MADLDELLQKKSKREFLADLGELREALAAELEAIRDGFDTSTKARKNRLKQIDDLLWFGKTYFPHYIRDRNVDGRAVPVRPGKLHKWLAEEFTAAQKDSQSHNIALAAARGDAKSTWLLIYVIWCIVRRTKRFMLYIMDVFEQAASVVEAVAIELELNSRLATDFAHACGRGRIWRHGEIVTRNKVKLMARGAGQRVRGLKYGAYRPDLALIDDIENDENVESPAQRDKLENWIRKAVANLGEAGEKFDILMVGTMLHHDSVLARIQRNPLWTRVIIPAIIKYPDRMDLWDEWLEIILSKDHDPKALEKAAAFYQSNAKAMNAGAVVSWPDKRPLLTLMRIRADVGEDAFNSEYQQNPTSKDAAFKDDDFHYFVGVKRDWLFFGACDPSLGGGNKGDPSALLIGGIDRETKYIHIVAADIRRRLPDSIIADMIALQREWQCLGWFVESVQFQEFFRTQAMKDALKDGVSLPCFPVKPIADKDLRIQTLQPPIAAGLIQFQPGQRTLLDQLKQWPKGAHDDGPDALEILWKHAPARVGTLSGLRGIPRASGASGSALDDYIR